MNRQAIVVQSGDRSFLVEIDPNVNAPAPPSSPAEDEGIPAGTSPVSDILGLRREFKDIQDLIVTVCAGLHSTLSEIPKPSSMEVEFGVKLGGEIGLPMVTKSSAEGSFTVKIGWKV